MQAKRTQKTFSKSASIKSRFLHVKSIG
eukprot:SAG31_NODE_13588_length_859_cov_0.950000_1_plen_27_part_10